MKKASRTTTYDFSAITFWSESKGQAVAITSVHYFHLLNKMNQLRNDGEFIKVCIEYLKTVKPTKADKAEFNRRFRQFRRFSPFDNL